MKKLVLIAGFILIQVTLYAQFNIQGRVTDKESGDPLPGAHVQVENTFNTAVTDAEGNYQLTGLRSGKYTLKSSFVGFKTESITCKITRDTTIHFMMEATSILGGEVNIVATRAGEKYPTAYTTISNKQIEEINMGKDLPYIVQSTPSVVLTSDAGNGIGYTKLNIRGTDLTRINVTINGIPVNDAESQGVWFVDLPDVASSSENIQIQRGVGTSTNGAGAFGASINILATETNPDPYGELAASYGSFNSLKTTLKFGSGILKSGLAVDGRLSYISSDGYIDRASSKLKSFYVNGGYYGKNTTLKLITFSGHERTYQAWEGVPLDSLGTNRTYNPAGQYTDSLGRTCYYKNQIDNYQQDYYQMIFSQRLGSKWNINAAFFLTNGKGYYESYKSGKSFSDYGLDDVIIGGDTITKTNLVNQKWLDNSFYGLTFSTNYTLPEKLRVIIGGGITQYYGKHFGKVIWAQYASNGDNERHWYDNTGLKNDINIYAKATWQVVKKLTLFADIQYRYVDYRMDGVLDDLRRIDQTHTFHFINNVGEAIMVNVPKSYRAGIEVSAGVNLWKKVRWDIHGTFSLNQIKDFTEYVDDYDSTWNFTGQTSRNLGTTNLSFSPGIVAGSILTYKPVKGLTCSLFSSYVGKQYIDNTSSDERSLHPYFVNNLRLAYSFKLKPFREIGISLMINNLFGERYETNAWIYRYNYANQPYHVNGYFPQALINYMAGITLKL